MDAPLGAETMTTSVRTEIAALPVADLARRFGTPTFVYDAAMILQRLGRPGGLRSRPLCPEGLLEPGRAGPASPPRGPGRYGQRAARSAAPWPPAICAEGTPPPIVYTADIFDAEALDLCVERGIHVNCGSPDMIEQLGGRAPGRADHAADQPRFRPRPQPQDQHRRRSQSKHGIWHEQIGRLPGNGRPALRTRRSAALHMHIGSGTDLEHLVAGLRGDGEGGRGGRSARSPRSAPAAACRRSIARATATSIWRPISPSGTASRQRLAERFGHPVRPGDRARPLPGGRERLPGGRDSGGQAAGRTRSTSWTPASTTWPGRSSTAPIIPCRSCRPTGGRIAAEREVIVGGPLCESGDIFTQEEGGFVAPRRLPEADVGDLLVIECAGAYGFVMGSNYNSRPLAAEVLIEDGRAPPDPPPADLRGPRPRGKRPIEKDRAEIFLGM